MTQQGAFRLLVVLLLLAAESALAQRVVVLEFEGDKKGKLRSQVEGALKRGGVVEVVSIKKYKAAASRKRLRGKAAMTPVAVAKVSRALNLDAAVEGAAGSTFFVRILDPAGQELWSKELKLKRGLLTPDHARKLAKAVAAAAGTAGKAPEREVEPAPGAEPAPVPEEPAPGAEPADPTPPPTAQPLPEIDLNRERPTSPEERDRQREEDRAEAHTRTEPPAEPGRDSDLDDERRKPARQTPGPKLLHAQVTGTTTWRSYCSRPGVSSCKEYDALEPGQRPPGDTVQFSPQVPYAGFGLVVELMPLARFDTPAKGLGVIAAYSRGFSLTNVHVESASGETPDKQVVSVDQSYLAMLAYRYFFSYGDLAKVGAGYAGLRGGWMSRTFDVDPNAEVPLPGSHRGFVALGADVAVPIARWVRVEVSGLYFLNPKAGSDEIAVYGDPTDATGGAIGQGFGFEAGLSGEVWGPLGYVLRLRYASFGDTFVGQGQKWQNGGAAQETYATVTWGATLSF